MQLQQRIMQPSLQVPGHLQPQQQQPAQQEQSMLQGLQPPSQPHQHMMPQTNSIVFVPMVMPASPLGFEGVCQQPPPEDRWPSSGRAAGKRSSACDGADGRMSSQSTSTDVPSSSSETSTTVDGSEQSGAVVQNGGNHTEAFSELLDLTGRAGAAAHSASRAEIFEEFFDNINRRDFPAMRRHRRRHWARESEMHWVDSGFASYGLEAIIDTETRIFDSAADLSVALQSVCEVGPDELELQVEASGIFRSPVLPLFPAGRSVRWGIVARAHFDRCGKVSQMSCIVRAPPAGLDISNLEGIAGSALALASTQSGSRLLQLAIASATPDLQETIIARLRGHIWTVAASPHGNHVLQKFITTAPSAACARLIAAELRSRAVAAAQDKKRSRVLERLFEYCLAEEVAFLADELVASAPALARDNYGNFVLQRLLEHGSPRHQRALVLALAPFVCKLARDRHGSNVVRAALAFCPREDAELVARALMSDHRGYHSLAKHISGSFVARELRRTGFAG